MGIHRSAEYLLKTFQIPSWHVALANRQQRRKGQVKQKTRSSYAMTVCMIDDEQTRGKG